MECFQSFYLFIMCLFYFAVPILGLYYFIQTDSSNYANELELLYNDYKKHFNSSDIISDISNDTIKYFEDYQSSYDIYVEFSIYNLFSLFVLIFFHIFIYTFLFCSTDSGAKLVILCCSCLCKKDTPKCIVKMMKLAYSKPLLIQFLCAVLCLVCESLEKKHLSIAKSKFKDNYFCYTIYEEVISLENKNITRIDNFCNKYYEDIIKCDETVSKEIAITCVAIFFSIVYMILDKCYFKTNVGEHIFSLKIGI